MLNVSRQQFTQSLSQRGGYLDVDQLSPQTQQALEDLGVSRADLVRIAGSDHVIRGAEFEALYDRLATSGASGARRGGDLARSERLFASLQREVDQNRPAIESRGSVGLRGELGNVRRDSLFDRADGARSGATYNVAETPQLRADAAAPEEPCWFVKMLEFLFQWIPGVSTDSQRLERYGRELADRHGSDIQAFRDAHGRSLEGDTSGMPTNPEARARSAMIDHLADRFQAEATARGSSMSRETAESRATTVVNAMEARMESNATRDQGRVGELSLGETESADARALAGRYYPARATADQLGGAWGGRLDAAMATPPADHPLVAQNPDRQARAENAARSDNVQSVAGLMAMQRSGQLSNVPPEAIDGLLAANRAGLIDHEAVLDTVSALQRMPASEREATLAAIQGVPEERRGLAFATLGREHVALLSSSETERTGALRRVEQAASQVQTGTLSEARAHFENGTLGLDPPEQLAVRHRVGGRDVTTHIPLYFHPSVTPEQRERSRALVREAYELMPHGALQHMMAGEGGRTFNVQVLPEGSMDAGISYQRRPDPENAVGGFFRTPDNLIRLNATEIERTEAGVNGHAKALGYVVHESTHYLDDLGDAHQDRGYFLNHDVAASRARLGDDGDLAPAWAHFTATRDRFREMRDDVTQPLAREHYMLSRRTNRTPAEERRYTQLQEQLAGRAGTVSGYGAEGGDASVRSPGINLGEWWAETYSNYLTPDRRDRLRETDPVAFAAAERYTELINSGSSPREAMHGALRFSLSTEVSAQQGQRMLADPTQAVSAERMRDLGGITDAMERHGRALDGWRPYRGDAGLKAMRRDQAAAGAREGRALVGSMDARLEQLRSAGQTGSAEFRELSALRTRLDTAVTTLERRAEALN